MRKLSKTILPSTLWQKKLVRSSKKRLITIKEILISSNTGVLPEQIFCDGWSIGYDERFPQQRRVQQALMFARFSEHDNLYAHPLVN